jgi:hypothetical protein
MNPFERTQLEQSRRTFLGRASSGLGGLALAALLKPSLLDAAGKQSKSLPSWTGVVHPPHLPPKCKRVIHLCMAGGASHLETLDYKPKLAELDGQPMPKSFTEGQQIAQLQKQRDKLKCLGPTHLFRKSGDSGLEISEILPHIASVADDICVIRSMQTDQINHDPAHTLMNTGTSIPGRPSMGSWLLYGLGKDSEDLPGYVVMTSVGGGQSQPIARRGVPLPGRSRAVRQQPSGRRH